MNRNFIVYKASAGSGKTFRLALEYITLALKEDSPDSFRHILAVTFTNKATAEMKDRILQQLYNLSEGGLDEGFLEAVVQELPDLPRNEIFRRAGRTLRAIVHDYDSFRVETIDSFFQFMLGNLAHEIGLTRGFKLNLNDKDVTNQAVNRLLLGLEQKSASHGETPTARWVFEYMQEHIDDEQGWNIGKSLKSFASKNLRDETYIRNEGELKEWFADDRRFDTLRSALVKKRNLAETTVINVANDFLKLKESPLSGHMSCFGDAINFVRKLAERNFEKLPSDRLKRKSEDSNLWIKAKEKGQADVAAFAEQVSTALRKLFKIYEEQRKEVFTCRAMLDTLGRLRLLGEIGHEVDALNKDTGHFMLSHTPYLFEQLVEDSDASFVFERVGTTFRHVMVDEFQDTARPQWNNIRRLLIENLSTGGKGFIVGDVKQSIYRWRGGDWNILAHINQELVGVRFAPPLNTNYRSGKAIVRFNNRFFPLAAQSVDAITATNEEDAAAHAQLTQALYADVEQLTRSHASEGYVRVAIGTKIANEDLYDDLHESIVRLHHGEHIPYSKMCILVRKKDDAAKLIDYFSKKHPELPLTSDEAYKLSASPLIRLVVAVLHFIVNPSDSISAIQATRIYTEILKEAAFTFNGCEELPPPLMEISHERENLLQMPLYELCEHILSAFGVKDCETKGQGGQSAYLFYFLDRLLDWLEDSPSSIPDFLDYWDDTLSDASIPSGSIADSISICTIHKAKGLAWHTVFLPFCKWDIEKDRQDDMLWCPTQGLPEPYASIPVTPVKMSGKTKESHYAPYYNYEHLQQRIDNLNLLYVAQTRAQENMLIWLSTTKGGKGEGIGDLLVQALGRLTAPSVDDIPVLAEKSAEEAALPSASLQTYEGGLLRPYTEKKQAESQNPLELRPTPLPISLHEGGTQVEFRQSNAARMFIADAEGEPATSALRAEYIKRGNLLHKVFSMIATTEDIHHAIQELSVRGLFGSASEAADIEQFVVRKLTSATTAKWFDGSWTLFNECNILTRNVQSGELETWRPDRVMLKNDHAVVLDFKFGMSKPAYREQVANYMRLLRSMGKTSVEGWIWYVYTDELEQVHAI